MQRQTVVSIAQHTVQISCLKAIVSLAFSVREWELCAPSRCRAPAAFARQVAMYLAHVAFGMPLGDVASSFGRDRSTAAYACRMVEERREDSTLDYALDHLEAAARLWVGATTSRAGVRNG